MYFVLWRKILVYNFFSIFFFLEEHEGRLAAVTFPTKQTEWAAREKEKIGLGEYLKVLKADNITKSSRDPIHLSANVSLCQLNIHFRFGMFSLNGKRMQNFFDKVDVLIIWIFKNSSLQTN